MKKYNLCFWVFSIAVLLVGCGLKTVNGSQDVQGNSQRFHTASGEEVPIDTAPEKKTDEALKIQEMAVALSGNYQQKKICFSWEKVIGAQQYALYYKADGKWVLAGTTQDTVLDTVLADYGEKQVYKIQALDAEHNLVGESERIKAVIPQGISALQVSGQSAGKVKLHWSASKGASVYKVYRKETKEEYRLVKTTAKTEIYAAVKMNHRYKFKIVPVYQGAASSVKGMAGIAVYDNRYCIAVDAGHQMAANNETEPIGPGASERKAKVSGGTMGVTTKLPEYKLTLQVALKLKKALKEAGYKVVMIRETNDIDLSNRERAAIANDAGADVFLRIHANGSENQAVHGMMTICQTSRNPYNAGLYQRSKELAAAVLDAMVEATGARREPVWETDTMSGINWAQVPVTIIEMGYMTNAGEDALMATDAYQDKIVSGILSGLTQYFELFPD